MAADPILTIAADPILAVEYDGGGLMGEISLCATPDGVPWSLIVGTSTGAIAGGKLATGASPSETRAIYEKAGVPLFRDSKYRNWMIERPWKGIYNRNAFLKVFREYLPDVKLSALKTKYMTVGCSLRDGKTHYFKSWEEKDGKLGLLDVISRSGLSAPLFFEPVDDKAGQQVWIDGGSGAHNCLLEPAIIECVRQGWHLYPGGVRILSLGTGYTPMARSYEDAAKRQSFAAISDFVTWAREEAIGDQMLRFQEGWAKLAPAIRVMRVDVAVPKKINRLDGWRYMAEYQKLGERITRERGKDIRAFLGMA